MGVDRAVSGHAADRSCAGVDPGLDRLPGGEVLGERDLPLAVGRASSSSCSRSAARLGWAAAASASSRGGPGQRGRQLGRVEPVQDGLGDERLDGLGEDRDPRRSRAGPDPWRRRTGGCRPSAAGRRGRAAEAAAKQAARQQIAADGRAACRAGSLRTARRRAVSSGVMIGSHSPGATISPRCSRWPDIRAEIEHPVERLDRPSAAGRGRDAAVVPVGRDRPQAVAGAKRAAASRTRAASVGSTVARSAR